MKLVCFALISSFLGLAHASNDCGDLLTDKQQRRISRLRDHQVDVKILTKTVAGKVRTVVITSLAPRQNAAHAVLGEDAAQAFDDKGIVAASSSQRVTMLLAFKKHILTFGDRLFARINLARLRFGNVSDFVGSPKPLDPNELRAKLINKFKWEYTLRSAYGREMMNRELMRLAKHRGGYKVELGTSSEIVPAEALISALNQPDHGFVRDLEVGTPMGKLAGIEAGGFILGAASFLFSTPALMLSLPTPMFLTAAAIMGHELTGLIIDIKAERNPAMRRYGYYKMLFPLSRARESELNRAVILNVDERLKSEDTDQFLIMVNPIRTKRLVKTFLNNGYSEEKFEVPKNLQSGIR